MKIKKSLEKHKPKEFSCSGVSFYNISFSIKIQVVLHKRSRTFRWNDLLHQSVLVCIGVGDPKTRIDASFHVVTSLILGHGCDDLLQQIRVTLLEAVLKFLKCNLVDDCEIIEF